MLINVMLMLNKPDIFTDLFPVDDVSNTQQMQNCKKTKSIQLSQDEKEEANT